LVAAQHDIGTSKQDASDGTLQRKAPARAQFGMTPLKRSTPARSGGKFDKTLSDTAACGSMSTLCCQRATALCRRRRKPL